MHREEITDLLLLRSYDHALDPESGCVDEAGGLHQVFFGAPKLVSQRCPIWPVLKSCFCVQRGRTVEQALGICGPVRITRAVFGVRQTDRPRRCMWARTGFLLDSFGA